MKISFGWLKDEGGGRFAPKTLISKVFNNKGKSLEKILEELRVRVGADSGEAKVGQHLIVEKVDRKGNPVKWRFADETEQVQANYSQTDSTKPDYIKNKPTIPSVANLVKNTDYATSTKAGIVKPSSGLYMDSNGNILINNATQSMIREKSSYYYPITPVYLDFAVKMALSDCKKTTWSEDEKQKARDLLGVGASQGEATHYVGTVKVDISESIESSAGKTFSAELYEVLVSKNVNNITINSRKLIIEKESADRVNYSIEGQEYYGFSVEKDNPNYVFAMFDSETLGIDLGTWRFSGYYIKEVVKQLDEKFIPDNIPKVQSASVGQILVVKAVNENGKPVEWECVDITQIM